MTARRGGPGYGGPGRGPGESVPGATLLHDCEVRLCCRYGNGHVQVGTQGENMRQAVARGRGVPRDALSGSSDVGVPPHDVGVREPQRPAASGQAETAPRG